MLGPFVFTLFPIVALSQVNSGEVVKQSLNVAGFLPLSKDGVNWKLGQGVLAAVQQAIHDINDNPTILSDYRLNLIWKDTKCDAETGLSAFQNAVKTPPVKIFLFGEVCSAVTESIANTSKLWNLVQLTYADRHPKYTKVNFPNLFRMMPNENEFNVARIQLMKFFNWRIVGTLLQDVSPYSLAQNELMKHLKSVGADVEEHQSFTDNVSVQMKRLKDSGVRIILGNFNETWARQIFCNAFHNKMYGAEYQWLIVARYDPDWWKVADTSCSLQDIEVAVRGALLMDFLPLSTTGEITISGRTPSDYNQVYELVQRDHRSRFHGYAYDGIWALALALHSAPNFYKSGSVKNVTNLLSTFRYHDPLWEKALLQSLGATNFTGITGHVRFEDNGRRGALVLIKQFQTFNAVTSEVEVGQYNSETKNLNLTIYSSRISWEGGIAPKDHPVQLSTIDGIANRGQSYYDNNLIFSLSISIAGTQFQRV